MKESFKLEIHASCVDGEKIECKIEAAVSCSKQMAVGVLIQLIKGNEDVKSLLMEAMMCELMERKGSDIDEEPDL